MDPPDGLAEDYLELLKGALTHTLYADVDGGLNARRNPVVGAFLAAMRRQNIVPVRVGECSAQVRREGRDWPVFAQTMISRARLDNLQWCLEDVIGAKVPGDVIETGVWRGGAMILARGVLRAHGVTDRVVWACDSFEGLPSPDPRYPADRGAEWHTFDPLRVSLEEVKENFARYGLLDDQVRFVKGWFENTLPKLDQQSWALIRLDGDMYQSTMDALINLYPNLSPGGYLIVDDYEIDACRRAVHEYRGRHGVHEPLQRIDHSGVYWQRAS